MASTGKRILSEVLDFGLNEEEALAVRSRLPPTAEQIIAMIVDEGDFKSLGRWGGEPQPKRRIPSR